jgi:hypothetical protein
MASYDDPNCNAGYALNQQIKNQQAAKKAGAFTSGYLQQAGPIRPISYDTPVDVEPHSSGLNSAIDGLEKIVAVLVEQSYDLESYLGMSAPECGTAQQDLQPTDPTTRIKNLANRLDGANYRMSKSLKHLRS